MTITIDLLAEALADPNERAQKRLADAEELPLDADTVEKIRRGLAEVDAGRTVSLEEARANTMALLAARYRTGNV